MIQQHGADCVSIRIGLYQTSVSKWNQCKNFQAMEVKLVSSLQLICFRFYTRNIFAFPILFASRVKLGNLCTIPQNLNQLNAA